MPKKIGCFIILILAACLFYACGDVNNSISNKTIASLAVSPTSAALTVGSRESFSATATYTDGTTAAIVPVWTATGSVGAVTTVGYIGLFTATAAGSGEIMATSGAFTAEATVRVTVGPTPEPGGLTTIEVTPAFADLAAHTSQVFTAQGINNSGEAIGLKPAWSISGDNVGTFTSSGSIATLEATTNGRAFIKCVSGEVSTTVPVTVEGATVDLTVEADTYIDEANPAVTMEGQTILKAGYVSTSGKQFRAFMRFPITSLPAGVTVEAVTLKVYVDSTDAVTFQVADLNGPFDATTTWNSQPSLGSRLLSATFAAGQYNNLSGNSLLAQVRTWYADPVNNFGLAIVQDTTAAGVVNIVSKEETLNPNPPILTVTYK